MHKKSSTEKSMRSYLSFAWVHINAGKCGLKAWFLQQINKEYLGQNKKYQIGLWLIHTLQYV